MKKSAGLWPAIVTLLLTVPLRSGYTQGVLADPTTYDFYPDSPLHLGGNFNPNDVAKPLQDCFNYQRTPIDGDGDTALGTTYTESLVLNTEQLKKTLNIDAKMDASYLTFKGGAQYSFLSDEMFSDTSLTLVLSGYSEYGRIKAGNPVLLDQYKPLLADSTKFENVCGSRFVSIERRDATVWAVVTIFGLSKEDHDQVTASLAASGGWGPISADASFKLSQDIQRSSQTNELSIHVVSTGGKGIEALSDLIKAAGTKTDSIGAIKGALSNYVKTFTASNAAPLAYEVTTMEFAGWKPNNIDLWTDYKESIARDMVAAYRVVSSQKDTEEGVLSGTDPRRALVSPAWDPVIKENIVEYSKRMGVIAGAWSKCKTDISPDGSGCVIPTFPDILVKSPIPKAPAPPVLSFTVPGGPHALGPVETRAFLQGVIFKGWVKNFLPGDAPSVDTVTSTNIGKAISNIGLSGFLSANVDGHGQELFGTVSVNIEGSPNYQDVYPAGPFCCHGDARFTLDDPEFGILVTVENYVRNDLHTLKGAGNLDRSATFAFHVIPTAVTPDSGEGGGGFPCGLISDSLS